MRRMSIWRSAHSTRSNIQLYNRKNTSASCVKTLRNFFLLSLWEDPFKSPTIARISEAKSQIDSSTATYDTGGGLIAAPTSQFCMNLKREIKSGRVNDRRVYPVTGYKRESRICSTRDARYVFRFYLRLARSHRKAVDLISKVPGVATSREKRAALSRATRDGDTCP